MAGSGEASLITEVVRGVGRVAPAQPPRRAPTELGIETARPSAEAGNDGVAVDSQATRDATRKVEEFVQVVQRDLQFSVDEESGRTVVTVRDSESGEVIRQIPPERMLELAENLDELDGLLFRGSA